MATAVTASWVWVTHWQLCLFKAVACSSCLLCRFISHWFHTFKMSHYDVLTQESVGRLEPVLTTDKAVDDMDNPAKAVMAILARTVPHPGVILGPGTISTAGTSAVGRGSVSATTAAAAGIRQLQLASSGSSSSSGGGGGGSRKVPLIQLSVCQTLTKSLAEAAGGGASGPGRMSNNTGSVELSGPLPSKVADGASGGLPLTAAGNGSLSAAAAAAAVTIGAEGSTTISGSGRSTAVHGSPGGAGGRTSAVSRAAAAGGSPASGGGGSLSAVSKAAIVSFKKVELLVGAMDLKTDQVRPPPPDVCCPSGGAIHPSGGAPVGCEGPAVRGAGHL
jgi:hypothetical protein